jgi:hypothetical protein
MRETFFVKERELGCCYAVAGHKRQKILNPPQSEPKLPLRALPTIGSGRLVSGRKRSSNL